MQQDWTDFLRSETLFQDKAHTGAWSLLCEYVYPFEALSELKFYIKETGNRLDSSLYEKRGENIWIAKSAAVAATVSIDGPAIIGEGSVLRPGAFLRGGTIIGAECVIGNSTELKNCILSDRVQVPHYNYVGDSVLGYRAHFGAGAVTSNLKNDQSNVAIRYKGEILDTGLRKCGAFIGDCVQIGCNCVLNPGTVIGHDTLVYPLCCVRGAIMAEQIVKRADAIIERNRKE